MCCGFFCCCCWLRVVCLFCLVGFVGFFSGLYLLLARSHCGALTFSKASWDYSWLNLSTFSCSKWSFVPINNTCSLMLSGLPGIFTLCPYSFSVRCCLRRSLEALLCHPWRCHISATRSCQFSGILYPAPLDVKWDVLVKCISVFFTCCCSFWLHVFTKHLHSVLLIPEPEKPIWCFLQMFPFGTACISSV